MTDEEWRPIPSTGGRYSASSLGRLRRDLPGRGASAGKILRPTKSKRCGYVSTRLGLGSRASSRPAWVHVLIAEAFFGPRLPGMQVNHINGDRADNRIANLEYVTPSENIRHAIKYLGMRAPTGEQCGKSLLKEAQVLEIRARRNAGESYEAIASDYGVTRQAIWLIDKRKNWKHI